MLTKAHVRTGELQSSSAFSGRQTRQLAVTCPTTNIPTADPSRIADEGLEGYPAPDLIAGLRAVYPWQSKALGLHDAEVSSWQGSSSKALRVLHHGGVTRAGPCRDIGRESIRSSIRRRTKPKDPCLPKYKFECPSPIYYGERGLADSRYPSIPATSRKPVTVNQPNIHTESNSSTQWRPPLSPRSSSS